MRPEDRRECEAQTGLPPEFFLPGCIGRPFVKTWTADGKPVAMGGVDGSIPLVGYVWLTSTTDIYKHKIKFLRDSKHALALAHQQFPILTNMTDARNTLHHHWLRWMGFVFTQKIDRWGAAGIPFYEFARYQNPCVSP